MYLRLFRVPIYIDLSFWIFLFFMVGITTGGLYRESFLLALVFTFSLLIHEYGHALAALFFGLEPIIILQAFGGRTEFNKSVVTGKQNFLIILSGPLFQGLLACIAYLFIQLNIVSNYLVNYLLFATLYINVTWFLLNLIPIAPLDGGFLMRYILEKKWGRKGYRASIIIGLISAAVVIPYLYFKGYYFFFIVQFLISGFHYCKLWQQEQEL